MQKLTQTQIDKLFDFTRAHYIEFYDVQTELVDHLANGIETQWRENPNMTFDDALAAEFKKFGIFGFSEVGEEKQKALEKMYRKEIWKHLKEYFKLPKIITTAFSIWAVFQMLQFVAYKAYVVGFLILILFIIYTYYTVKESRRIKKLQKETGKKWLFESMNGQYGVFANCLNIGVIIAVQSFDAHWDLLAQLFFSISFVIFSLIFYILTIIVRPKLLQKYAKENPEYKVV